MSMRRPVSGPRPGPAEVSAVCLAFLLLASGALAGCLEQFRSPGAAGEWALDFLTDDRYSELVVEIDHESGAGPESRTLDVLQSTLEARLNKPGGIDIRTSASIDGKGKGAKYSFEEIRALEEDHRDHRKGGDRAILYVMFLDGGSNQDSSDGRVLGAAYSGSSMVMFKDNLRHAHSSCQSQSPLGFGCPSYTRIEDAVTTHELGHVLGLVNLNPDDVPMVHAREDSDSDGHSQYEDSVMYYAVRTSGNLVDFLLTGKKLPTEFDQYDIEDLRNAGGR